MHKNAYTLSDFFLLLFNYFWIFLQFFEQEKELVTFTNDISILCSASYNILISIYDIHKPGLICKYNLQKNAILFKKLKINL